MVWDDQHSQKQPLAAETDPEPFYSRCDELRAKWDRLRKHAQSSGNKARTADVTIHIAGFALAAAATLVTTLVAANVHAFFASATTAAILAALATIATGIQASGMISTRAEQHYERVHSYRKVRDKAANVRAQVAAGVITLDAAFARLDELVSDASRRPGMSS